MISLTDFKELEITELHTAMLNVQNRIKSKNGIDTYVTTFK